MEDLYQDIVLEHSKRPRNRRAIAGASHRAKSYNPLCGDEVEVYLRIEDGRIVDASFQGQGCAISTASASIMSEVMSGLSPEQARSRIEAVMDTLRDTSKTIDPADWGDLAAVVAVRKYPGRVKCASLAWQALEAALDGRSELSAE